MQPRELSQLMRQVRCLALPSLTDHLPLVVAESTASGLALAMSNTIGSRMDLANDDNAVLFAPRNRQAIEMALRTIANWSDIQWQKAETTSRRLSSVYGPARFVAAANQLVEIVSGVTA